MRAMPGTDCGVVGYDTAPQTAHGAGPRLSARLTVSVRLVFKNLQ